MSELLKIFAGFGITWLIILRTLDIFAIVIGKISLFVAWCLLFINF